jgi:hypothetical protein
MLSHYEKMLQTFIKLSTQVHNAHLIGRERKHKKLKTQGTLV